MARESLSNMKNSKAKGPLSLVLNMQNLMRETGHTMFTDLLNQIRLPVVIPADLELSSIMKCYKGKRDTLEIGNHRGCN